MRRASSKEDSNKQLKKMKQAKTLLKLLMLPKADLDIIRKAKEGKAGEGIDRVNNHLTPIMVLYGLADMV